MRVLKKISSNLRFVSGSKKYFLSSLFFPKDARSKLTAIYNFCRIVDDCVDENSREFGNLFDLKNLYLNALKNNKSSENQIIDAFLEVKAVSNIPDEWPEALFNSMEMDLSEFKYATLEDTLNYTYGVAEVVGLMVSKAFEIEDEYYEAAQYAGRAAQWANYIRDIGYDISRDRQYFSNDLLKKFELKSLRKKDTFSNQPAFQAFIDQEVCRYNDFVDKSLKGFNVLPDFLRNSLSLATLLDKKVVSIVQENPMLVYEIQAKPKKREILRSYWQVIRDPNLKSLRDK